MHASPDSPSSVKTLSPEKRPLRSMILVDAGSAKTKLYSSQGVHVVQLAKTDKEILAADACVGESVDTIASRANHLLQHLNLPSGLDFEVTVVFVFTGDWLVLFKLLGEGSLDDLVAKLTTAALPVRGLLLEHTRETVLETDGVNETLGRVQHAHPDTVVFGYAAMGAGNSRYMFRFRPGDAGSSWWMHLHGSRAFAEEFDEENISCRLEGAIAGLSLSGVLAPQGDGCIMLFNTGFVNMVENMSGTTAYFPHQFQKECGAYLESLHSQPATTKQIKLDIGTARAAIVVSKLLDEFLPNCTMLFQKDVCGDRLGWQHKLIDEMLREAQE